MDQSVRMAPLVLTAKHVSREVNWDVDKASLGRGKIVHQGRCSAIPLSVFLIFELLALFAGKPLASLRAAGEFMLVGARAVTQEGVGPSRVLVVSIGGPSPEEDLPNLASLFPPEP